MRSQRGSTLIQVLLVILIFSILGISILSGVVGENKRVHKTDEQIQERNIARDGLTYFEADFKRYVKENAATEIKLKNFLDLYAGGVDIPLTNGTGTLNLSARLDAPDELIVTSGETVNLTDKYTIEVTSLPEGSENPLYGYYRLDIDTPVKLLQFNGNAEKVDFSDKLLSLDLLGLLTVDLLTLQGNYEDYYPVPNDKILSGGLAGLDLLGLLGLWNTFNTMETKEVIAVSDVGLSVLEANIINNLLDLNVINLTEEQATNVLINGSYTKLELLGGLFKKFTLSIGGYKDIDFKKFAVTGNALIEQDSGDTDSSRTFSFADGLFVNKSLNIGGLPGEVSENDSNLVLNGDMAVMENLYMTNTNFETDNSNLFVHEDAEIKNSCINSIDTNKDFRLFVKGKLTIDHDSDCNNQNGLLYAGEGIQINTNKNMAINGGVIGEVSVIGSGTVTIYPDPDYLEKVQISNAKLIPLGRAYE